MEGSIENKESSKKSIKELVNMFSSTQNSIKSNENKNNIMTSEIQHSRKATIAELVDHYTYNNPNKKKTMEPIKLFRKKYMDHIKINDLIIPNSLTNMNLITNEDNQLLNMEKLSKIENLNEIYEMVDKEDYINLDEQLTKQNFITRIVSKSSETELDYSDNIKIKLKENFEKRSSEVQMDQFLQKTVMLKEESKEFMIVALNEYFIQCYNSEILIKQDISNAEINKFHMNNLIFGNNQLKQTIIHIEENSKINFDLIKKNEDIRTMVIKEIENFFYEKFPKEEGFMFNCSTIIKGSTKILINHNLDEKSFNEFNNKKLNTNIFDFIIQDLNDKSPIFTADMIDPIGNFDFTNSDDKFIRGGLDYYQPKGWIRIGLKVKGEYDDGDDSWLAMNGNKNEWAVGFHGTRFENVKSICKNNLINGPRQVCENFDNLNILNNQLYEKCGKGVYFGQCIEVSDKNGYCNEFEIKNGYKMKIAFQCRVNPLETRICSYGNYGCKKAFIVPNPNIDNYETIRPNIKNIKPNYKTIRPYGILVKYIEK